MTVSIVMPVYNAEAFVEKAIASTLAEELDLELFVCDDASTDGTYSLLKTLESPQLKIFKNETNLGYLKTCNMLFDQAQGEFMAFQDADDWSAPGRIAKQVEFLKSHPEVGVCCTDIKITDENGRAYRRNRYPENHDAIVKDFSEKRGVPLFPNTAVFRRSVYEAVGGYREFFNRVGAEDGDWLMRISHKFKIANLPEPLYFYRRHRGALSAAFGESEISFHTTAIAYFLYTQRLETGTDAIMRGALEEVDAFLEERKKKIAANPYPHYQNLLFSHYLNGSIGDMMKLYCRILKQAPLHFQQYLFPARLLKLVLGKLVYR